MLSAMAVVACLLAFSLAGKDGGEGERRERLLGEEEVAKRERERSDWRLVLLVAFTGSGEERGGRAGEREREGRGG